MRELPSPRALPYTVRSVPFPMVALGVLALLISLPFVAFGTRDPQVLWVLPLIWVPIGLIILGLAVQRIVLLPDALEYATLSRRRLVRYVDVTRVEIRVVRGRGGGYILAIHDTVSPAPLSINLRPFGRRDLALVVDTIASRAPRAVLDEATRRLRAGQLPV